jgi:hypothetical protein
MITRVHKGQILNIYVRQRVDRRLLRLAANSPPCLDVLGGLRLCALSGDAAVLF